MVRYATAWHGMAQHVFLIEQTTVVCSLLKTTSFIGDTKMRHTCSICGHDNSVVKKGEHREVFTCSTCGDIICSTCLRKMAIEYGCLDEGAVGEDEQIGAFTCYCKATGDRMCPRCFKTT
jgi:predicted RNA-binding Zn-ribbon protein involved in translation (DUF1610 family)